MSLETQPLGVASFHPSSAARPRRSEPTPRPLRPSRFAAGARSIAMTSRYRSIPQRTSRPMRTSRSSPSGVSAISMQFRGATIYPG